MTTTVEEVGLDLGSTSLEDHEFEIPCDVQRLMAMSQIWAGPQCDGSPARWIGRRRCCGGVTLLCDDCKDEYVYRTEQAMLHTCVICSQDHSGYHSFEPLTRAS